MEDKLKIKIKNEELKQVDDSLKAIEVAIGNYLIALTGKEKMQLPKLGDKSVPFVEKVIDYSKSNEEFVPAYIDPVEMESDFKALNDLQVRARNVKQLLNNMEDTMLQVGSEAYVAALAYYNSVKTATKLDVPNAKTIYDDLRKRFEHDSSNSGDDTNA